jgi:hypothetical protein
MNGAKTGWGLMVGHGGLLLRRTRTSLAQRELLLELTEAAGA